MMACESCAQMENPESYIRHLCAALDWYESHIPMPTNPNGRCVVLEGKNDPDEVLFINVDKMTRYTPEETCKDVGGSDKFTCSDCGCNVDLSDEHGEPTIWVDGVPSIFWFCPHCGRRVV